MCWLEADVLGLCPGPRASFPQQSVCTLTGLCWLGLRDSQVQLPVAGGRGDNPGNFLLVVVDGRIV
uniref:Uncharacterized protein n=1 Tax=Trichobilharzia regenti TaxID=157069 RepID=A0AA85K266_TRIRE|nr:unnamed protein product [Trichobilharzia regenti]